MREKWEEDGKTVECKVLNMYYCKIHVILGGGNQEG